MESDVVRVKEIKCCRLFHIPIHVAANLYVLFCVTISRADERFNFLFIPKCVPGTSSSECFVHQVPYILLFLEERKIRGTFIKEYFFHIKIFLFVFHLFTRQRSLEGWITKQAKTPTVASKLNYHSPILILGVFNPHTANTTEIILDYKYIR